MTNLKRGKIPELLGLLIFPILGSIYGVLNQKTRHAAEISSAADDLIPFLPIFIIPYIAWYGYIVCSLLFFWRRDRIVYWKTLAMIAVGEIICFIVYFTFQTTVPRPELTGDSILIGLTAFIYSNDQPVNCFPSIHVLTTGICMVSFLQIQKTSAAEKYAVHVTGTLIILSTVFVKQHVIYDVAASVLMSVALYYLAYKVPFALPAFSRKKVAKGYRQIDMDI